MGTNLNTVKELTPFEQALELKNPLEGFAPNGFFIDHARKTLDPKWEEHKDRLVEAGKKAEADWAKGARPEGMPEFITPESEKEWKMKFIAQRIDAEVRKINDEEQITEPEKQFKVDSPESRLVQLEKTHGGPEKTGEGKEIKSERPTDLAPGKIRIVYQNPDDSEISRCEDVSIADFVTDKDGKYRDFGDKQWRMQMALNANREDGIIRSLPNSEDDVITAG